MSRETDDTDSAAVVTADVSTGPQTSNASTPTAETSSADTPSWRSAMTPVNIVVLLFAVATAATGQVLLKHGMSLAADSAVKTGSSLAARAATSPWVLLGLAVFAVSALAWLITLSRLPLNIAYPFNALGYLVILIASVLILNERANLWTWVGTLSVVVGLIVIVANRPT